MGFKPSEEPEEVFTYIPKAHVQFLEQAGIRVVPISFMDSADEITALLNEVNGIYVPGDSHKAITNVKYQESFSTILQYVQDQNKAGDYFPMMLMGKAVQTLVSQVGLSNNLLHDMKQFSNTNLQIDLIKDHDETFLFH